MGAKVAWNDPAEPVMVAAGMMSAKDVPAGTSTVASWTAKEAVVSVPLLLLRRKGVI